MKPRRWYSSPEVDPNPGACKPSLPETAYWNYTTRTRLAQGSIIKSVPPDQSSNQQRRAAPRGPRPIPLIDAA